MSPSPKRKKQKQCFAIVSAKNDKYIRCKNVAEYYIEDGSLGYCTAHYRQFSQKGVIISRGDKKMSAKPVCFGKAKSDKKFKTKKCTEKYKKKKFDKIIDGKLPPDTENSGLFSGGDDSDSDSSSVSSKSSKSDESESDSESIDGFMIEEDEDEDGFDLEEDEDEDGFMIEEDEDEDGYRPKKKLSLERRLIQTYEANDYNDKPPKYFANWLKYKDVQQYFETLYFHNTRNQVLTDIQNIVESFDAEYNDPSKTIYKKRISNTVYLKIKDIIKKNIPVKYYSEPKVDLVLVYLFEYPSRDLEKKFEQYGIVGFGQSSDVSPFKTIGKTNDYGIFPYPHTAKSQAIQQQSTKTGGDGSGGPPGLGGGRNPTGGPNPVSDTTGNITAGQIQELETLLNSKDLNFNNFGVRTEFLKNLPQRNFDKFKENVNLFEFSVEKTPAEDISDTYFPKVSAKLIFDSIKRNEEKPIGFGFYGQFAYKKYSDLFGKDSIYSALRIFLTKVNSADTQDKINELLPDWMKTSSGRTPAGAVSSKKRKNKGN